MTPALKQYKPAIQDSYMGNAAENTSFFTYGYSIIMFNANPPDITPKSVLMEDEPVLMDCLREDPVIRLVDTEKVRTMRDITLII
ncbi:MAG: hypothetical protein IAC23_08055 [Bacteroidetes bacterium]|uniref:Uncharacterized protein n=1 Tax=Candidatus Cryptobacteroides merdavium TaxID=2840769 RepID=A0A9D9EFX6_9BACT|nr:hypothetical protein [Candidatus Cryptobacteroides merdavium]